MKRVSVKVKRGFVIVFSASMLIIFSLQPAYSQEIETLSDSKKTAVETPDPVFTSQSEYNAPLPEVTTTGMSSTTKWLLYGGGAAAAGVGILAVAISSSGGGDDSSSVEPDVPPIGPSIYGKNWAGTLDIQGEGNVGNQSVTAVVTQNGDDVTISTSSTLAHGQFFLGYISASGYLKVIDTATNQTWTTYDSNATGNSIYLYDYVNDFDDFDTLFLIR